MPPRRKRAPEVADQPSGNLRRESTWAGLRRGDAVEVTDTRLRSATWEFVALVRNIVTGDEWVEVVGGKPGVRNLRSFHPERVLAPTKKRGRSGTRPSLADAPRLPLG
jgi:hypothetical protein